MAAIFMNAANLAYRKTIEETREKARSGGRDVPEWLAFFVAHLPMNVDEITRSDEKEHHRKKRQLKSSSSYEITAGWIYKNLVTAPWFDAFIMANIFVIAIVTGMETEGYAPNSKLYAFVSYITLSSFTLECILKIVAEGRKPWMYFLDSQNGNYNKFDFGIVVASFLIIGFGSQSSVVGAFRILRILRLLSFVKRIPQLRVIISGLFTGIQSVIYILTLLILAVYILSIVACVLFGGNDPARFGSVGNAMLTLFQVTTLSWSDIAYTNWYGCSRYLKNPGFNDANEKHTHSPFGGLIGFRCGDDDNPNPVAVFIFFYMYIITTSWVIMSLFVGVIAIGMLSAFMQFKEEEGYLRYAKNLQANMKIDKNARNWLAEHIDLVLRDDPIFEKKGYVQRALDSVASVMKGYRDSAVFTITVNLSIFAMAIVIGIDVNRNLEFKRSANSPPGSNLFDRANSVVTYFAQAVFTLEALIKILSEGSQPQRYFTGSDGNWNRLDFFVVVVGFIDLSPASYIFASFPMLTIRLLRLFRLFRIARTLPRLRSIVDALINSFSSVGWIVVLIVILNYIMAIICMILFGANDPFHFGNLARSFFSILQLETLNSWNDIMFIALLGCDKYPGGYPYISVIRDDGLSCSHPVATGWLGAGIIIILTTFCYYVIPTLLIGIISIRYDESMRAQAKTSTINADMYRIMDELEEAYYSKKKLESSEPRELTSVSSVSRLINAMTWEETGSESEKFFNPARINKIIDLFYRLDASGDGDLNAQEISPFYFYVFEKHFGICLSPKQFEDLFSIMDMNMNSSLGYEEFVIFLACIKMIQWKCSEDANFQQKIVVESRFKEQNVDLWEVAMKEVDTWAINATWKIIIDSVDRQLGDDLDDKIKTFFCDVFDDSERCDEEETLFGLRRCGVNITKQQMNVLFRKMDKDKSRSLELTEFISAFKEKKFALKRTGQKQFSRIEGEREAGSKDERIRLLKNEVKRINAEIAALEKEDMSSLSVRKSPSVL